MTKVLRSPASSAALALLVLYLAIPTVSTSCKSPTLVSGSSRGGDLTLSARIQGAAPSLARQALPISPLLLPAAATLTLSLEPSDPALPTPAPATASIPSSGGAAVASVTIKDVAAGEYKVLAIASDSTGVPLFQGSASASVSGANSSASVVLLPVGADTEMIDPTPGYQSFPASVAAGAAYAYAVPPGKVSSGGSIPAGSYELSFNGAQNTILFFALDSDGSILFAGQIDMSGYILDTGGNQIGSTIYVYPTHPDQASFLVFYQPNATLPASFYITFNTNLG